MENLFSEILKDAKEKNDLIAIYTDKSDTDRFAAGYIIEQIEEGVFFNSINPYGIEDGIIFFNINDIYAIETQSIYLRTLKNLFLEKEKTESSFIFKRDPNKSLINDVLSRFHSEKSLIKIKLIYGMSILGYIDKFDEEIVCMKEINEYANNDGFFYFKSEDIEKIFLNGLEQKKISILNKLPPLSED